MIIDDFSVQRKTFVLDPPFQSAKTFIQEKEFIYITFHSSGFSSIGEINCFPELGTEQLDQVENALYKLIMDLRNCNEPTIPAFKEIIDTYNKYPATVSGVEQAFLSLYAKVNHLAIQEIFSAPTHPFVNVNGLIGFGTPQDVLKKIQNLVEEGYRTIKLKMGYEDFATEKEILNSIPKEYDNIKFRLDLNAAIDTDEALSRLDFYMKFNIEYIEDLFRDDHQYETIELPSSIKFAAEISPYSKTRFDKLLNIPSLSYLIAKPSISGSLFQMIEIKKFAQQFNKKLVITHAVDGRIGMKKSLVLAALIDGSTAHGLMPVYMEEDVNTIEIPRIQRGSYSTTNLEL